MSSLLHDLRLAWRNMLHAPGFAAVVILTLALGIGANTVIFTGVRSIVQEVLPFPDAGRLFELRSTHREQGRNDLIVSWADFAAWRAQSSSFAAMAAVRQREYTLTGGDHPVRVRATRATAALFDVLGVEPVLGRRFLPEEDVPDGPKVTVISQALWQRRFAGDPDIVGRTVELDREPFVVVGVLGEPSYLPHRDVDLWTPLGLDESNYPRNSWFLRVFGRLQPDVSIDAARAEMDTIARRLEVVHPDLNTHRGVFLVTLAETVARDDARHALRLLGVAVGLVLLIGCANVANLLLSRAASRQHAMSVCVALGAGRARLVRQMLTESLLFSLIAGALGVVLSMLGLDLLAAGVSAPIPELSNASLDMHVLLWTLALSIGTGLLFGLVPALRTSRPDLDTTLKATGDRSVSDPAGRLRGTLIVVEFALALVLLVGAGLLVRSLGHLHSFDPGFDMKNLLTVSVSLPDADYPDGQKQTAFFDRLLEQVGALPGVKAAAVVDQLPMSGRNNSYNLTIEGRVPDGPAADQHAGGLSVSPGYFNAMGIPLRQGADFTVDGNHDAAVVVVNETFARRFWPGETAVGRRMAFGVYSGNIPESVWLRVVGVIGDVYYDGASGPPRAEAYRPFRQLASSSMYLVMRTSSAAGLLAPAVRARVEALDPHLPVHRVATMETIFAASINRYETLSRLLGLFAGLALVLASVGIYSVMSYAASRRAREMGIRLALGAGQHHLMRLVLGRGLLLAGGGVAVGLFIALGAARLLRGLLFGVAAVDPLTFGGVAVLLIAVALLACWVPARRAGRTDPMIALRQE